MEAFHAALMRASRAFGVALVLAMLLVLAANIVCREAFGIALVWADETAITLFVWTVFVGAGISFGENARIRFTYLAAKLPGSMRAAIELLVSYAGLVLLGGFVVTGAYVAYVHRNGTFTTMPYTLLWEWMAVPVGPLLALEGWMRHGKWTPRQAASSGSASPTGG